MMTRLLVVATIPITFESFLCPYAEHYRSLGWRVDAMGAGVSGSARIRDAFDETWDVPWSRSPLDPRNLLGAARRVREIVERETYDIVHVHTPVASFVTRFALRHLRLRTPLKVVYTAHGFHFFAGQGSIRFQTFLSLEKLAGTWTDELVVMNEEDFEQARRHLIVPTGHLHHMHGIGVDTAVYDPQAVQPEQVETVRREMGLASEDSLFLLVGEFIPRKRHELVLKAFSRMRTRSAHLALAGDGPLVEHVARIAAQLGIDERVHFLGYRTDIPALLTSSLATILVSEHEGLPRSVMESLCMGTPVIGADIRGIRDLLADGSGLLVPREDPGALAVAMDQVAAHPDEAADMGAAGREKILAGYSLEAVVREHDELYSRTIGGGR
jgi:glycosyltransferase involved in cell wall biosynthesis